MATLYVFVWCYVFTCILHILLKTKMIPAFRQEATVSIKPLKMHTHTKTGKVRYVFCVFFAPLSTYLECYQNEINNESNSSQSGTLI